MLNLDEDLRIREPLKKIRRQEKRGFSAIWGNKDFIGYRLMEGNNFAEADPIISFISNINFCSWYSFDFRSFILSSSIAHFSTLS